MRRLTGLILAALAAGPAFAEDENPLAEYLWMARPFIVFSDTENDPRYIRQMEMIAAEQAELDDRDVVVLTDIGEVDSDLRDHLRPRGFMIVLVGKDGQVKLRKPFPWNVRELSRAIDKMPMRQQEMRGR